MANSQHKHVFIQRLMHERDKFELLLNRVGYGRRMTMKGVAGAWSIKDMIASIWMYEQYMADRLGEILQDEIYIPCKSQPALDAFLQENGYPDFDSPLLDKDKPNGWLIEKYKNIALDEIIAQEISAFSAIIEALEAMDEGQFYRHNLFERVSNNTYRHYREHIAHIKHWLKVNAA